MATKKELEDKLFKILRVLIQNVTKIPPEVLKEMVDAF